MLSASKQPFMALTRFHFFRSFLYYIIPSIDILNFLRSLYPPYRPVFVCNATRWYWYGDEKHCKCCLYEVIFESLAHATLANLEYAAESGCRRCRIILLGIRQFLDSSQDKNNEGINLQVWDTPGAGVEVLVSYPEQDKDSSQMVTGNMALEFFFHEGSYPSPTSI